MVLSDSKYNILERFMSEICIQETDQPSIKVHLAATLHMFTYYVHSLHEKLSGDDITLKHFIM